MADDIQLRKSVCYWCKGFCGVIAHVRNEHLVGIEPDPDWPAKVYPPIEGCVRRKAAVEYFYHPSRLHYPRKRVGERGENKWEAISWKQALDEIAAKIKNVKDKYGPEAVSATGGTLRTMSEYGSRFLKLLGSPNYVGQERICFGGRSTVADTIVGLYPCFSIRPTTKCVVLLGVEPMVSRPAAAKVMLDAQKNGGKIICIDPRKTRSASIADIWLPLRAGTDVALLLGMINVVIEEDLYDKEFATKWCHGMNELKERLKEYPLEKVQEITGIPVEQIRAAARMYATNKPGTFIEGMGVEHAYNSAQTFHARWILAALVGNMDVEGGEELLGPSPAVSRRELEMAEHVSPETWRKALGTDRFRLFSWEAQQMLIPALSRVWGQMPNVWYYQVQCHSPVVWRAIINGDPYPIRALITNHSNPMVTQSNTRMVYKALKSPNLELYVVMDMFMTPSAQLADYVLPAATWLERPDMITWQDYIPFITVRKPVLPNIIPGEYEHYRDFDLWRELGIQLGQEKYWPWKTLEEAIDDHLKPAGLSYQTCPTTVMPSTFKYKKYEEKGFGTPTQKVENYSTIFEKLRYDPLPSFTEPHETQRGNPELAKEYPLNLISGARVLGLFHSEWRQVEAIRKIYPYPRVQIHPETAKKYGISEGDWVWIETRRGRIRQVATFFADMDPSLVSAEHGWWLPELPGEEPWLHGVWDVNVNVILDDDPDHCNPIIGTWPLKTALCKIYKVKSYAGRKPVSETP